MFLVLSIILGITIICFSVLKKNNKKEYNSSKYMSLYYDSLYQNNKQKSYEFLSSWCNDLLTRLKSIEKEKDVVDLLYSKRLLSEETYNKMQEDIKNLHTEKMIIEQEAQAFNKNIFKECKVKAECSKQYKIYEDIHFNKKREALENNLRERLLNHE